MDTLKPGSVRNMPDTNDIHADLNQVFWGMVINNLDTWSYRGSGFSRALRG